MLLCSNMLTCLMSRDLRPRTILNYIVLYYVILCYCISRWVCILLDYVMMSSIVLHNVPFVSVS